MTRQKMNRVLKTANCYQGQSKDLRCINRYDWGYHYNYGKAGCEIKNMIDKISNWPEVDMFQEASPHFILVTEENVHEFLGNVKSVKTIGKQN